MSENVDIIFRDCGTIALVTPRTKKAHRWVGKHVALESWQWVGEGFAVEPRYIPNLSAGVERAGLTSQIVSGSQDADASLSE